MKTCSIAECDSPLLAHGWCRKHYLRWYKHGDPLFVVDKKATPDVYGSANRKHGLWKHPLYPTWHTMMQRCYNPKNRKFPRYGGRGIEVCRRWHDVKKFVADMGERPPGMSLDRINNDGPYSPKNCRWATRLQQARNRPQAKLTEQQREGAVRLYKETKSPALVAKLLGLSPHDVKNAAYGEMRRSTAPEE